jgi:hypothetical protein
MLKQDSALLYDAAQSFRLANRPEKALILYKNYLQLYPNEANAEEVQRQIDRLKQSVAATDRSKTPAAPKAVEPNRAAAATPPVPLVQKPVPITATSTEASASVTKKKDTPTYKKWWVWTIVGVVVAGGAATTAVLLTRPRNSWSNAPEVGPGSANALVRW